MRDMRSISIGRRSARVLHVEAPGCVVNIHHGLLDSNGQPVTAISIQADCFAGETPWLINGESGRNGQTVRLVQTKAPTLNTDAETLRALLAELDAATLAPSQLTAYEAAEDLLRRLERGR